MSDIEVYLDWQGECRPVGLLRRQPGRGRETVSFQYNDQWINARDRFSIDASLKVGRGTYVPGSNQEMLGSNGWTLSPAYDLNPTPQDLKPRILTTNIDFDEGTCSMELVREVASFFGLNKASADQIISEVASATSCWRDVATAVGARPAEIRRMDSAFEHKDLEVALNL